ncbi:MAG: hypothetical protein P1V51_07515 [Deltaproteobacteria bacterium]|nr:hypothetical protein [Deltaproteobacteria bacterium]
MPAPRHPGGLAGPLAGLLLALPLLGGCPPPTRLRPDDPAPREQKREAETPEPEPLDAPLEPPRHLLLRHDARLHRVAHTGTTLGHDERSGHAHPPGEVSVYRLVADHGAWLEVESLPGETGDAHCHEADGRLRGLTLRLFVHRSDVARVLRTSVTQHYPDGTSLRLAPGVGVSAPLGFEASAGAQIRHLQLSGLALNAEIPDTAVGTDYTPSPLPDPEQAGAEGERVELPRGAHVRFGLGARVRLDEPRSARVLGTASGQRRVNLGNPCVELVALVGSEETATAGSTAAEEGARPGLAASVAPGTDLFWPDGRRAGRAVHLAGFERIVSEGAGRTCLARSVPLWPGGATEGGAAGELELCVPSAAVVPGG